MIICVHLCFIFVKGFVICFLIVTFLCALIVLFLCLYVFGYGWSRLLFVMCGLFSYLYLCELCVGVLFSLFIFMCVVRFVLVFSFSVVINGDEFGVDVFIVGFSLVLCISVIMVVFLILTMDGLSMVLLFSLGFGSVLAF